MTKSSARVFARIRPHADTGGHAARRKDDKPGKKDVKQLGSFTSSSITMRGGAGDKQFDYMDRVILPAEDQEVTYSTVGLPQLLHSFLDGFNVTLVAFGQTGTGKTHTLFGSELELVEHFRLDSGDVPELWGLFPRALISALDQLKDQEECKLTANVLEIYMGECLDLLNNKVSVNVSKWGGADFGAFGLSEMEVSTAEDVANLMKVMNNNRSTRSTAMNDVSSRSHCIASLSLTRVLHPSGQPSQVRRSTFMFADLAGSERLEKTGMEAKSSDAAWEGLATNWDLFHFGRCIDVVVEAVRKGKKPFIIQDSTLSKVMTKPLEGNAFVAMVVCLSQSCKNGGETWFSLCYGERLSKLTAGVERARARSLEGLIRETEQALKKESEALAVLETTETGRNNKWYRKRVSMVKQLSQEIKFLQNFK